MFLKAFGPNRTGRDFAIGDLHGMYNLLFSVLEQADFDFNHDRCFSVGDLIDRGPQSEQCMTLIEEPWFHPVCGNHEDTLRTVVRSLGTSSMFADWLLNGGRWHLKVPPKAMHEYANLVDTLPYMIQVELNNGKKVALCHAEHTLPYWAPEEIEKNPDLIKSLIWSRKKVQEKDQTNISGIDHIICGHTIVDAPTHLGNTHFIDTGAFMSNTLTLIPLNSL